MISRDVSMGLLIVALLSVTVVPVAAQEKHPLTFEDALSMARVSDPQPSPDGETAAYVVRNHDLETNGSTSAIWLVELKRGGEAHQLTRPPQGKRDHSPRWSANGQTLAFLSNRSGNWQIWKLSMQGGEPQQWSDLSVSVGGLLWSPEGSHFAFTASVFPDCEDDVLQCTADRQKKMGESGIEARLYDKLFYRHWVAWEDGTRSHVFVIPADGSGKSGEARDLTPGDSNVPPYLEGGTGYDFSPDGEWIAFARNVETEKFADEALSTNSDIWVVPVAGGEARRVAGDPGWDGTPQYSPDGEWIAFAMMYRKGFESDLRHLMLYNRQTGETSSLTSDFSYNIREYLWTPDSSAVYFTASVDARAPIHRVLMSDKEVTTLAEGVYANNLTLSADGSALTFVSQASHKPNEVFTVSATGGEARQISYHNDKRLAEIAMNRAEAIYVEGAEGAKIHSWLIKPPGFDPSKKYPVVVLIHGGPQGAWTDSFHPRWNMQLFAAPGYVVVAPNPRGSPGWGQKFVDEISRDWGGKVYTDIMNVVDHVAALPYTDEARMCAGGGSYGGYMTDWILGHTDRFRCLFSHAGVYNLESMYGSTEELWFVEWDLGGPYWSHPEDYEKWSPHKFVEKFKTPTLVIQGALDYRVPLEQSLQLFTHLQRRGVKSKFLFYPDEGHWILKPKNSQLWYETVHAWLAEHLK